ncbi:MAG: pilin [Candidatus Saccharibacteria bacterium]|nr:pilin [Candidatus Saccharibacteria bacterium]
MKHLKRNIVFAVLGMVFCGGLLCGDAWASMGDGDSVTVTPDDSPSSHYTLTCKHSYNQYYYVRVSHLQGGAYQEYDLDASGMLVKKGGSTFAGSTECEKRIELFKTNLGNHHIDGTSGGTSGGGTSGGTTGGNTTVGNQGNGETGVIENEAVNGGKNTSILTGCDTGNGQKDIECIIKVAVDIFTAGVGILGVTGIIIVGIQYLTAGGDEGKMTKAKRRMYEIVIGLVLYMLGYALLKWLLPTYN